MRTRSLLIRTANGKSFLLVGYSGGKHITPKHWQLPSVANEYGDLNVKAVVKKFISNSFGLTLRGFIDIHDDLIYVEVEEDALSNKTVLIDKDDPEDLFEHRQFVNEQTLRNLLDSKHSLLIKTYGFE